MRGWLQRTAGGLPRPFWFLWAGTLINRIGAFVVIFIAIYLTGERDFSQSQAGLVIGVYGVGGALGTAGGGVLADRWGRRPTMLTAQFGAAALMLTLGFARPYWQILAATFLLAVFTEAVRPAFMAMMVDVVPDRDRVRAFSLTFWAINLGFALSAVGAGLAAKVDYLLLFVVDAGTTLATALISLLFLAETRPHKASPVATTGQGGLLAVLRDRTFLTYTLISFSSIAVMMQFMSMLPIAMTADGFSPATFGWVISVNGVLIVLGQLFVPRLIDGRNRTHVLAVAALLIGIGFGLVAFAGSAWFFALTVAIWTLGEMLQSPSNAATVAALSPVTLRGSYQGVSALTWSAGTAFAPVLGGLTRQHFGNTALWLGCFAVCALGALGHLLTGPSRERRIAALQPLPPPTIAGPAGDTPLRDLAAGER